MQPTKAYQLKTKSREHRVLNLIQRLAYELDATSEDFVFSLRDVQQRIKGQTWVKIYGANGVRQALIKLEEDGWITNQQDKWVIENSKIYEVI